MVDRIAESEHIIGGRLDDKFRVSAQHDFAKDMERDFLRNTKVSSLFPEKRTELVTVSPNDSVATAFQRLVKNNILSVPVYDYTQQTAVAFLDMLDIVCYLLGNIKGVEEAGAKEWIQKSGKLMEQTACKDVAGISGRNMYYPIEENCSLLMALKMMVNNKVHRLPVITSANELVTIVTQSHAVSLICKHIEKFAIATQTVGDLQMGTKSVVTIGANQKVVDAFQLIHDKKVSGVGVVDGHGNLLGNISASDVKFIGYGSDTMSRLCWTVDEFLTMKDGEREKQGEEEGLMIVGPVCVTKKTTFEEVVTKVVLTHTHRVYIVGDDGKPIGVISLGDILETLISTLPVSPLTLPHKKMGDIRPNQ